MKKFKERVVSFAAFLGKMCALILIWQTVVWVFKPSPIGLPGPFDVWLALKQIFEVGFLNYSLIDHVSASAYRLSLGYGLCLLIGIPLGLMMGSVPFLRKMFVPFISLSRPLPSFAWLAVLIVWLGFGDASKIAVIFLPTSTIVALGAMDGVLRVPPVFKDTAKVFGASSHQMFTAVVMPAASVQILSSARVALAFAWAALIAAELVASETGIGVIIIQSARFLRTDQTFAGLIILAFMGGCTDYIMKRLQKSISGWANN